MQYFFEIIIALCCYVFFDTALQNSLFSSIAISSLSCDLIGLSLPHVPVTLHLPFRSLCVKVEEILLVMCH